MVTLANTADSGATHLYNFVTNKYPFGVTLPYISDFGTHYSPLRWYDLVVTDGTYSTVANESTYDNYFYFPGDPGTPSGAETLTGNASSSNYRFYNSLRAVYGVGLHGSSYGRFKYSSSYYEDIVMPLVIHTTNISSTTYQTIGTNHVTFAAATNQLLIYLTLDLGEPAPSNLENFTRWSMLIQGWMSECIWDYITTPSELTKALVALNIDGYRANQYNLHRECRRGINSATASANNQAENIYFRPFQVDCQTGSYSIGSHLTDFMLYDDSEGYYRQVGKLDNRIICSGVGTFIPGKIYEVTDVFGRTGTEHWFCVGYQNTESLSVPDWVPGVDVYTDPQYHLPSTNEMYYIMLRIHTEAD